MPVLAASPASFLLGTSVHSTPVLPISAPSHTRPALAAPVNACAVRARRRAHVVAEAVSRSSPGGALVAASQKARKGCNNGAGTCRQRLRSPAG
ncbi:hypothetical protein HaLaN_21256 [Haematococcus lacustris]|uniref:Uncharacterized protein n=1 Tax=Haematococcus lacustris TaxID=44745 RepID=A0A699ZZ05_HAELA|nr:hypothetical protein HaLaN_21256 [Haematococcus lacustris]